MNYENFPTPMGICEICQRPFEYFPNPNWESIKHLFKRNPIYGFWLPKPHPDCDARLERLEKDEKEKKLRDASRTQVKRMIHDLGFSQILVNEPAAKFQVDKGNERAYLATQSWRYCETGILLFGPPGRGKSHLMASFAHNWIKMGMDVVFQNMTSLLTLLRRGYNDDLFDERLQFVSSKVQILILDDLGAEKPTEWSEEKLYMIIDTRLRCKLPLFVTTNCSPEEFDKKFHPRILSRLKEICTWIEVGGRDWRRPRVPI